MTAPWAAGGHAAEEPSLGRGKFQFCRAALSSAELQRSPPGKISRRAERPPAPLLSLPGLHASVFPEHRKVFCPDKTAAPQSSAAGARAMTAHVAVTQWVRFRSLRTA